MTKAKKEPRIKKGEAGWEPRESKEKREPLARPMRVVPADATETTILHACAATFKPRWTKALSSDGRHDGVTQAFYETKKALSTYVFDPAMLKLMGLTESEWAMRVANAIATDIRNEMIADVIDNSATQHEGQNIDGDEYSLADLQEDDVRQDWVKHGLRAKLPTHESVELQIDKERLLREPVPVGARKYMLELPEYEFLLGYFYLKPAARTPAVRSRFSRLRRKLSRFELMRACLSVAHCAPQAKPKKKIAKTASQKVT
jgi:hypothetical protein